MTSLEPHDQAAEEHIIGVILTNPNTIPTLTKLVRPEHFYLQKHAVIYTAILNMHHHGVPIDPVTVSAELERTRELENAGGRAKLIELVALTPTATNAPTYAGRVRETHRNRTIARAATRVRDAALNGGIDQHPELAQHLTEALTARSSATTVEQLNLTELLAGPIPDTSWLWEGWLATDDLGLLVGDPKAGKSLLALGLAAAVRTGSPFLGAQTTQMNVGIFDLENPLTEIQTRLRRIGLTHTNHAGLHYFRPPTLNLTRQDDIDHLAETILEHNLGLIFLDSFRRIAPGVDENDSGAISQFFAPLRAITTQGRSILTIHHTRKRSGDDRDQDIAQMTRGSGDFVAAVDVQLYARRSKEANMITLQHGASRRGLGHAINIIVSKAEDEDLTFTNDGIAAAGDSKRTQMLTQAITALREAGGTLNTTQLMTRLGIDPKTKRTFYTALDLGVAEGWLARTKPDNPRTPTEWAIVPQIIAD